MAYCDEMAPASGGKRYQKCPWDASVVQYWAMDIERVSSELLRALRGSRSQVAFSRRLGYRSNVSATWESGRRWPTAAVVLAAAARVGIDVEAELRRFVKVESEVLDAVDPTTPEGVAAILTDWRRDRALTEIAKACGASRYQVSRWLSGASQPRLPDFLSLVQAMTQRLLDFVSVLVDPASLPSVAEAWAQLEAARSLFWRVPAAQLVLLGLDLRAYRSLDGHSDEWLAGRLGLEVYEVVSAIQGLAHTGQIEWEQSHWAPARVQTVDTRRHPAAGPALKRWWTQQALDRLDRDETSWSYNAFTVSEADLPRIVELYRSTYRAMRSIVAGSEPSERMVLVHQVVVPLDDV